MSTQQEVKVRVTATPCPAPVRPDSLPVSEWKGEGAEEAKQYKQSRYPGRDQEQMVRGHACEQKDEEVTKRLGE